MRNTVILLMMCYWCVAFISNTTTDMLQLTFCDVGQGDATLLQLGSVQILVDAGPSPDAVLRCLSQEMPFYDSFLEVMILTHADADHIGGANGVLEAYSVGSVIYSFSEKETDVFTALKAALQARASANINDISLCKDHHIVISDKLFLSLVIPGDDEQIGMPSRAVVAETQLSDISVDDSQVCSHVKKEGNDGSIALNGQYNDFSFFLSGDLEYDGELALLSKQLIKKVNVLKVGHHGSKSSTHPIFLGVLKPEISVISVGKNNAYQHPAHQVTARISESGSRLYLTSEEGSVTVMSNGSEFWMKL